MKTIRLVAPVVVLLLAGCRDDGTETRAVEEPILTTRAEDDDSSPPDGWQKTDELPGNLRRLGTEQSEAGHSMWLRAGVIRVEPWYGRVLELDEGQRTHTDEDWVAVDPTDERLESDSDLVFKVYLEIEHQFHGDYTLPEFFVADGDFIEAELGSVARLQSIEDAVWLISAEPWFLYPHGRPPEHETDKFVRIGPGAEIYPIGTDGELSFPGYSAIEPLERKAAEPDTLVDLELSADGNALRVKHRTTK